MQVAVVREFGKPLVIEEVRIPEVGLGQILAKIAATGYVTPTITPPKVTGRPSRTRRSYRGTKASATSSRLGRALAMFERGSALVCPDFTPLAVITSVARRLGDPPRRADDERVARRAMAGNIAIMRLLIRRWHQDGDISADNLFLGIADRRLCGAAEGRMKAPQSSMMTMTSGTFTTIALGCASRFSIACSAARSSVMRHLA